MDCDLDIEICANWELNSIKERAWQSLPLAHYNPNIFLTIDWLKLWWEVYAKQSDQLHLVYIWKADNIVAIFPAYIKEEGVVRFVGTGEPEKDEVCSEYLDVLIGSADVKAIYTIIAKHFEKLLKNKWSFVFDNVLLDSHIFNIAQLNKFNTITEPVGTRYFVSLPATFEEYRSSKSRGFISQVVRKKRRLERLNSEIVEANNHHDLTVLFNKLVQLHTLRWNEKGSLGAFSSDSFTLFHTKFAHMMFDKGCLSMKALKIDNDIVGVIYNFIYGDSYAFYQMGIDTSIKKNVSIGTLLHFFEIESSIKNKAYTYDFMKGNAVQSYKKAFTNNQTPMFKITLTKKTLKNVFFKSLWEVKQWIKRRVLSFSNGK